MCLRPIHLPSEEIAYSEASRPESECVQNTPGCVRLRTIPDDSGILAGSNECTTAPPAEPSDDEGLHPLETTSAASAHFTGCPARLGMPNRWDPARSTR